MTLKDAIALLIEVAEQADTDEIEQGMGIDLDRLNDAIRVARRASK